ncbi:hook-length control protein FliK [Jannaschia faecimaris]|uniref:Hook-length control protein FliK n=1 Tax=Jannaschia faecimaris TaxID=1244108 RepID=A0A1H3PZ50_9RHOB|nr:flagellar hook-length control protein FliK [Jannaschia faecimaris]SDZ06417.1 hook-length control protein FliK [Jannaschia faecimaris]
MPTPLMPAIGPSVGSSAPERSPFGLGGLATDVGDARSRQVAPARLPDDEVLTGENPSVDPELLQAWLAEMLDRGSESVTRPTFAGDFHLESRSTRHGQTATERAMTETIQPGETVERTETALPRWLLHALQKADITSGSDRAIAQMVPQGQTTAPSNSAVMRKVNAADIEIREGVDQHSPRSQTGARATDGFEALTRTASGPTLAGPTPGLTDMQQGAGADRPTSVSGDDRGDEIRAEVAVRKLIEGQSAAATPIGSAKPGAGQVGEEHPAHHASSSADRSMTVPIAALATAGFTSSGRADPATRTLSSAFPPSLGAASTLRNGTGPIAQGLDDGGQAEGVSNRRVSSARTKSTEMPAGSARAPDASSQVTLRSLPEPPQAPGVSEAGTINLARGPSDRLAGLAQSGSILPQELVDRPVPLSRLQVSLTERIATMSGAPDDTSPVRMNSPSGSRTAEVELAPAELGKLRLVLQTSERGLHLVVTVERPEMIDTVRRQLDGLHRALMSEGITLDSVDIGPGDRRQAGSGWTERTENEHPMAQERADNTPEQPQKQTTNQTRMPDGRLDLSL